MVIKAFSLTCRNKFLGSCYVSMGIIIISDVYRSLKQFN